MLNFLPRDSRKPAGHDGIMANVQPSPAYRPKDAFRRVCEVMLDTRGIDLTNSKQKAAGAKVLGINHQALNQWENRGLPYGRVIDVAEILNVDIYYLLGRTTVRGAFGITPQNEVERELAERLARLEQSAG